MGCTTFMKVAVIFKEPVASKFPDYNSTNGSSYKMIFISKKDTIRSASEAIVTFKWPADTLQFEQVQY